MRVRSLVVVTIAVHASGAAGQALARPAAPPQKPVTDTYFGTSLTDRYRYMENLDDTAVTNWMRAEGKYTSALFASVPARAALLKEAAAASASYDFVNTIQLAGTRTFYEERVPGSDNFDLMVREADGSSRKLVDVGALRAAHAGSPYAINYYVASPKGEKVAVGISAGGSEDASLFVYDVRTGRQIAPALALAEFGVSSWTDDGRKLFVILLAKQPAGAPPTAKYLNSRLMVWDLKRDPVPLLGGTTPSRIAVAPQKIPSLYSRVGAKVSTAVIGNGTENELELWTAPSESTTSPTAPWVRLTTPEDGVTNIDFAGDRIYLLSHKGAPNFQVLTLRAGEPMTGSKILVAGRADRLLEGIGTAKDGLYLRVRRGLYSELVRMPLAGGSEEIIALPFKGSISEMFTDPTREGATILLQSWTIPPTVLTYEPSSSSIRSVKLGATPAGFDPNMFTLSDLSARAKDGTQVPLSYVERVGAKRPHIVLMSGYGSYGLSSFAGFGPRTIVALKRGIAIATCHVRGGGELGEAWRLGGKDANKSNTWRDLIACGDELVASGYTTPDKLFIEGGSAGGITMGRALEERPDLFAGVIDEVPAANTVRQEVSPNGVPNIPEFGTVKTDSGFRNLLAMDSYLHVKDGTQYPAVLITTGLNDPRVAPWEPAKFAARLQASGTKAPVLLRVDDAAGHGIGSTKSQIDELFADELTFIFWRAEVSGWDPRSVVQ
ncbi:MAG TPA: prolyl oligopeptidase family serine peptidase [Gemmatimonadaceae bacterium]|nr:prolyl oligopeptidase family serine peptidase [Gemmatimonadaceae bacterium]